MALEDAAIVKGTVQVSLGFWMSAGSWYTPQTKAKITKGNVESDRWESFLENRSYPGPSMPGRSG